MGSSYSTCIFVKVCFIHKTWVQHLVVAIYFALDVDKDIDDQQRTSVESFYLNIQVEYDEPIPIYCDNTSVISISKNPLMHSKMNHIPIKYHFLWEQVVDKNFGVEYVGTK